MVRRAAAVLGLAALWGCASTAPADSAWRDTFTVPKGRLKSEGMGTYAVLKPGTAWTYRDGDEVLTITVLDKTETIDGVAARVVEEREQVGGKLKEISRNYFAIDPGTGDVYYFGEEVDIYKDGRVDSHEGAWRSGAHEARFGLFLPGSPKVGDRFYQEVAPGIAMDRVEIVSVSERVQTPAGTYSGCVHTVETTPLEAGKGHKWFAPGVGLIKDGDLALVSFTPGR